MKTTIDLYDFRDAFHRMGRADQFSYEGLRILFDYLEEMERDIGEELELDVIALCCDYSEDTIESIAENYRLDLSECGDDGERAEAVREMLYENGAYVGETTEAIVYRVF